MARIVPSKSWSRQQMEAKSRVHRPKTPEQDQQILLFRLIAHNLEDYPELAWIWATPNGGHRHKKTAVLLKAQGVKAGVWDIFCAPRFKDPGMWIEMKAGKNKLSELQIAFQQGMEPKGYTMKVCYSAEAAAAEIEEYYNIELDRPRWWQLEGGS